MNDPFERPPESTTAASWRSWLTIILAVIVLVPSFVGFGTKFWEFLQIYTGQVDGVFAIGPILNYLLASAGFLLLLLWGTLNGMFHDIEQPKFDLLEREEQIDAGSKQLFWKELG
jgi:hypothetical protein